MTAESKSWKNPGMDPFIDPQEEAEHQDLDFSPHKIHPGLLISRTRR